jgi:hypothetical protein|tara:strand:+ start:63 stop:392 length:330 start_codon:yes stop_codon:yes gene_type:complete
MADIPSWLMRPFDPKRDKPIPTVGSSKATEYLGHHKLADGEWVVYPTIWFDREDKPRLLNERSSIMMLKMIEVNTDYKFPRFEVEAKALSYAKNRSKGGGATKKSLLSD